MKTTTVRLVTFRLTCPECLAEYEDTTAETEVGNGYFVFRCPHCHKGQIVLAVLRSESAIPAAMPEEYHETIPGVLGWIDLIDWHGWPWQWHWKKGDRP